MVDAGLSIPIIHNGDVLKYSGSYFYQTLIFPF